ATCSSIGSGSCCGWLSHFPARHHVVVIFFFQAEDGIRDDLVTGVQTCALPISIWLVTSGSGTRRATSLSATTACRFGMRPSRSRSEERRVGKEWRSRWSPAEYKKKSSRGKWTRARSVTEDR